MSVGQREGDSFFASKRAVNHVLYIPILLLVCWHCVSLVYNMLIYRELHCVTAVLQACFRCVLKVFGH